MQKINEISPPVFTGYLLRTPRSAKNTRYMNLSEPLTAKTEAYFITKEASKQMNLQYRAVDK